MPELRPDGFAVIVRDDVEFMPLAGVTESQVPPVTVLALGVNETAPPVSAGEVVNVICCEMGVVEPAVIAAGVQDVRLGIATGGGVPVTSSVPSVRVNTVGLPPPRT